MKLKITLVMVYPDNQPTAETPYATRNIVDSYEQEKEVEECDLEERIEAVIKAFNDFKP